MKKIRYRGVRSERGSSNLGIIFEKQADGKYISINDGSGRRFTQKEIDHDLAKGYLEVYLAGVRHETRYMNDEVALIYTDHPMLWYFDYKKDPSNNIPISGHGWYLLMLKSKRAIFIDVG